MHGAYFPLEPRDTGLCIHDRGECRRRPQHRLRSQDKIEPLSPTIPYVVLFLWVYFVFTEMEGYHKPTLRLETFQSIYSRQVTQSASQKAVTPTPTPSCGTQTQKYPTPHEILNITRSNYGTVQYCKWGIYADCISSPIISRRYSSCAAGRIWGCRYSTLCKYYAELSFMSCA